MTFRAGIVGCGRIGSEFAEQNLPTHAGSYSATQGVEMVALSDLDENKLEKAGKRWGITSLYHDYIEMLKKENLDILSICTRKDNHLEITKEAVNNGVKAIYCEKPIADTLPNADEMIRLCQEKEVVLQVNHQRRFDSFYQEVKGVLQKGRLGEIQQAAFYYSRGIANTGSHMFDLLRFFFGDVDWVQAAYSQNKSHNMDDPNIDGVVKFGGGLSYAIQACADQNIAVFDMDFIGTRGRLKIIRNGSGAEYYEMKEGTLLPAIPPVNADIVRNSMVEAVEHLIACLKEGKESTSSGKDGRAALELICAFHESAANDGKMIKLPLRDSKVEIKPP
jgi:predicted dehydrogenase